MRWGDVIMLISSTPEVNSAGDVINNQVERQVFANKTSITRTEFYQAQASGLKPEIAFEIRAIDYANETKLKFETKDYNIIRTYSKDGEILELVCNSLIGG